MAFKADNHSFVILAYKQSPYLRECILSLRQQTIESNIIIATSTPSQFLDILSEEFQIPVLINPNRGGIAEDWSFAYGSAQTDYVTLAHQDDIYLPRYTELCLAAAGKQKNNLIVFTDYTELFNGESIALNLSLLIKKILLGGFLFQRSLDSLFMKKLTLSFGCPIACPSVMYHRRNIGSFNFSENFCVSLDWDAWLKISEKQGSFIYVKQKLLMHRIHKDTQTSLQIQNNVREKEDTIIFLRMWPKVVARCLSYMYSFSLNSNKK